MRKSLSANNNMSKRSTIAGVIGICCVLAFSGVSCSRVLSSTSAEPTADTPTFFAPLWTPSPFIIPSDMPDENLVPGPFVVPSSTPGELYTPSPVPSPSDIPTKILIFASPRPDEVQGIRGQVMISSGPAPDPGAPSSWPGGNLEVVALEAGTTRIVAKTVTDSQGYYTLELMPGAYNICVNSHGLGIDRPCDERVIVTAGIFVRHDMGVAME